MSDFTPMTEEQVQQERIGLSEGDYPATILDAKRKIGQKSGAPYLNLQLKIWKPDGNFKLQYDFLIPNGPMGYKTRHAAESAERLEAYESGSLETLANELIGKHVTVRMKHRKRDGELEAFVSDYIKDDGKPPFDDDIAF